MKEFETEKFYYGFPIFLIGYKDKRYGYNFTTMSSSYSLDDVVVCAMGLEGGAYSQIKESKNFSINIIPPENKHLIENGAYYPNEDKFTKTKQAYKVDSEYDVPLIEGCNIQLICNLSEVFFAKDLEGVVNVVGKIKKRLIDEKYIINGEIDIKSLQTLNYFSDQNTKDFREVHKN